MKYKPFKKSLSSIKTEGKPGSLSWANLTEEFKVKRVINLSNFTDLNESNKTRGQHANPDCNELLFILQGNIRVFLREDIPSDPNKNPFAYSNEYHFTCKTNDYVMIPKNHYLEIEVMSKDAIYFVLCDSAK